MRPYIQNLTDTLIGKNRFDLMFERVKEREGFIDRVQNTLEIRDVRKMNPETLGRILCSLEVGDVMVGRTELFGRMHFCGDCEDMLRELVSLCLAYVICDRLDPFPHAADVPPYRRGN